MWIRLFVFVEEDEWKRLAASLRLRPGWVLLLPSFVRANVWGMCHRPADGDRKNMRVYTESEIATLREWRERVTGWKERLFACIAA